MVKSNLYKNTVLSNNPKLYYLLNGTSLTDIPDETGNTTATWRNLNTSGLGQSGIVPNTNRNSTTLTDATTDYLEIDNYQLDEDGIPGIYTFEMWINYSTSLSGDSFFCQFTDPSENNDIRTTSAFGKIAIQAVSKSTVVLSVVNDTSSNTTYHIVFTLNDDRKFDFFLNGVKYSKDTDIAVPTAFNLTSPLTLGSYAGAAGPIGYSGRMSDAAIYEHVLSDTQITQHYEAGVKEDLVFSPNYHTFGNNRIRSFISSNASNGVLIQYCSYINPGLVITGHRDNPLMLGGIPLSTSLYTSPSEYFYALDVIEDTSSIFHIDSTQYSSFQFQQGKYLATKKEDGRFYWTMLSSDTSPTIRKEMIWNGVKVGIGELDELILNKTSFTVSQIDEYINVMVGGIPLTVGRIENNYYLVISPATVYDIE